MDATTVQIQPIAFHVILATSTAITYASRNALVLYLITMGVLALVDALMELS